MTVTDIVPDRLAYLKGKYTVATTDDNRKAAGMRTSSSWP